MGGCVWVCVDEINYLRKWVVDLKSSPLDIKMIYMGDPRYTTLIYLSVHNEINLVNRFP